MSDGTLGAVSPPLQRELRIDRVLGHSFSLLGNRLSRYFLLSALPGLPSLLVAIFSARLDGLQSSSNSFFLGSSGFGAATAGVAALMAFAIVIVMIVAFTAIYVAMIYGVFQDMRGQEFRLGEGLGRGLSRFWPLVGLWICAALGIAAGLLLLIVPGMILFTMWWVAAPACVIEQLGPIRSLERSGELTRGNRWRIFAIVLVISLGSAMVGGLLTVPMTLLGMPVAAAVLNYIWSTLTTAYHLIATVVAYYELRLGREGIDASSLASVFD